MNYYISKISGGVILAFKHRGQDSMTKLSSMGVSSATVPIEFGRSIYVAAMQDQLLTIGDYFCMDLKSRNIAVMSNSILSRFYIKLN